VTGRKLAAALHESLGMSWSEARSAVATGKVTVDGHIVLDERQTLSPKAIVAFDPARPRPHKSRLAELERKAVVYIDPAVVVVDKPSGISTVPFGDETPEEARATLDALVREILANKTSATGKGRGRAPLGVVHRLDKDTSGLLVFARTLAAKKHLSQQFRQHTTMRKYVAIVHGALRKNATYRSMLVEDRGDGIRGSAGSSRIGGQLAVTHVEPLEPLAGATLVACRLETGRTHQIRIHLAEAGHPLVGEPVYVRNYPGPRISAPRAMLHAIELGFVHPSTEKLLQFRRLPPRDFEELLAKLRG
jgi:23S rRNA pseudouridine1911/1915/1917 synthase